jgi:4-amino-4-deoxy-L-arabinose transferase-like glycosyltransferase
MTEGIPQPTPEKEPSVLDLYKSITKDWMMFFNFIRSLWDARQREGLNQTLAQAAAEPVMLERAEEPSLAGIFPWRTLTAFGLALAAQALVEPPLRLGMISIVFYFAAFGVGLWALRKEEWRLPTLPESWQVTEPMSVRLLPLILSVILAALAFLSFGDGLFTAANVTLWALSILLLAYSFWARVPKLELTTTEGKIPAPVGKSFSFRGVDITFQDVNQFYKMVLGVSIIAAFGISLFFRLHLLDQVPLEPFSDHAEKILDVYGITEGDSYIFFERNTGREAFQMYWSLLVINVFGTGFSFYSLKLGAVLLGILTIPFVYQLGREYGNERVAFFALFLFGVASWPNIISRIGLRFPLYPLFTAPTLLYLTRGLRTQNRNDFILAGIFLGLGLHGYSPFRIVPLLVIAAFALYFLHARSNANRQRAIFWFLLIVIVSAFIFLPLLRYWLENPSNFGYRAFTRLSSLEAPLPGPVWQVFLSNLYKGLLMFNWDDGKIGTHSVTHRPALDLITGALFLVGVFFLFARYLRQRDWRDAVLLVSIPILILPSVLSLAFPGENPAMNRAAGASVTVFVVAALALDGLVTSFGSDWRRKAVAYTLVAVMFAGVASSNYDLVFNKYAASFSGISWNSSEMGKTISDFEEKYGQTDTIWIVPFPYWVDTRLPGVWAGVPNRDFALWQERLPDSLNSPAPKMFIFWNADTETERILKELYPNGSLTRYTSAFPGRDFFIFLVEQ